MRNEFPCLDDVVNELHKRQIEDIALVKQLVDEGGDQRSIYALKGRVVGRGEAITMLVGDVEPEE